MMTLQEMKHWLHENDYIIYCSLDGDNWSHIRDRYALSPDRCKRKGLQFVTICEVVDRDTCVDGIINEYRPQVMWYLVKYITESGKTMYDVCRP
jgi:hypothetical protein